MKRMISSALLFSMFALPLVGIAGCGEEAAPTKEAPKAGAPADAPGGDAAKPADAKH